MFVADTATETDKRKMLLVAGYAENQAQLDEAFKAAKRGRPILPPEDSGLLPVPTDFFNGAKIKVTGKRLGSINTPSRVDVAPLLRSR